MTRTRREFSRSVKRDAFARSQGHCENPECGQKLFPGNIEYDHDKEDFFDGEPTLENCVVLCRGCHRAKTIQAAGRMAKTRRQQDKHTGAAKPKSRFPNSRDGKFKTKLSGETVQRTER